MTSFNGWTFTWEHGRELASLSKDGTTWTNTYNADGIRTKRTNGSTTYNYVYNGSSLSQMSIVTGSGGNTATLNFVYDANGAPMAVIYNGTTYYYVTNLQGDVIAILDSTGAAVVQYMYDAWGKLWETTGSMATTLGVHNPLRYRGYVYDPESSLYYLQSRYYDPELGRFINADIYPTTGQGLLGNNMFAYCNNDPTNHYDSDGRMPQAVEDAIIHNKVLKEICGQNGDLRMTQTCIYYNQIDAKNGWGFCDLYNISTGEVWELKKNSNNYSCTTIAAKAQLDRYVSGRLKHHLGMKLFTPYTTHIASGTTSLTMNGYNYSISYWNEGEGILRYSYTKNKTETRKTVEAFATAAAVVAVVAYCAPSLLPGMVAAIPYAVAY